MKTQRSKKLAHQNYMELEFIIEEMGNAMREANTAYLKRFGTMTPHMRNAVDQFFAWAERQ